MHYVAENDYLTTNNYEKATITINRPYDVALLWL